MSLLKSWTGRILGLSILILVATVAWIIYIQWINPIEDTGPRFPDELSDVILPTPIPLEEFELLDHNRKPFTRGNFKGHWSFLFFGYTHCPDVCPMALGMLSEVFSQLTNAKSPAMVGTQGVFVTVDPKRDTPEHLKQYVLYFNPDFLGISGTDQQIKAFSKQIGAMYFMESDFKDPNQKPKAETKKKEDDDNYKVSHTSAFFLIDPLGRLVAIFPEYNNTEMILEEYIRIRKFVKIRNIYGNAAGKEGP